MKTIFRLLCGWMAIALTTACSHEELLPTEPVQKPAEGKMVSVKAYTPSEQPASRLAFEDKDTDGLKLSWSEGDAFTAVVGNSKVTFTYDAHTKKFSGTLPDDATLTDEVSAYYPAYTDEYVKDFSTQTGALNSATTYMEGAYDATAQAFRFNHSTAILKVAFSGLPQNAEIESISIDINNASIIAINDVTGVDMNSVYFNLPALAKGSKLVFYVETTAGLYTSTQTVTVDAGIEVEKFYVAPIALAKATVCNLPMGSTFCSVIGGVIGDATSIVFEANSTETGGTQIGSSTAYAKVVGTTLKIYTAANEFVFNENCSSMFYSLGKIQTIDFGNHINTENVTLMNPMFLDCYALESITFGNNFNTAKVTDMNDMFEGCERLVSLDVSSFNTENVKVMYYMFKDCSSLTSLDLSSFDFSKVINFLLMFYNLGENAANQPIPVYVTMASYNILKDKDTNIPISATYVYPCELPGYSGSSNAFNSAITSFLSSNTSLTKIAFIAKSNTTSSNQIGTSGAYMVAGSDNTLEIHTAAREFIFPANSYRMFYGLNTNLKTITAIHFNDCVNTAAVTNMGYMFAHCESLTSLNVSNFNTANVTNMKAMFCDCYALTSLNVTNFNTANVTDMGSMFRECYALTSLNVTNFNTEKVTDMSSMFRYCSALTELDLCSFTFSATTYSNMFLNTGLNSNPQPIPIYVKSAADKETLEKGNTLIDSDYATIVVN